LASSSPRRREILELIKLPHKVITVEVDESLVRGIPPEEQVELLSRSKARAAAERVNEGLIIAADTLVVLDEKVLGKPENVESAIGILKQLLGRTHRVFTGVTVWDVSTGRAVTAHECTVVEMRQATHEEISRYVRTGEPMDKAGAYGIQGLGSIFITGIQGCYFNVMGLPVYKLTRLLRELGLDVTRYWE